MPRPLLILRLLARLKALTGGPLPQLIRIVKSFIEKLLANPQIAELWRFIVLGTVVETGRLVSQKVGDMVSNFFVVKATFTGGDFAYDWVKHYLDSRHVWDDSRAFSVIARNKETLQGTRHTDIVSSKTTKTRPDGHPRPVYEPAPSVPEYFRWRGYWLSATAPDSFGAYSEGGSLVISMWSRNRSALDDFVSEAREFYINSPLPPRRVGNGADASGSLLVVKFNQGDWTYDWIINYMRSTDALRDVTEFAVTAKQSDLDWGTGPKDAVRRMPDGSIEQMFLFNSEKTASKSWVQLCTYMSPGQTSGGLVTLTFYNSNQDIVDDFIEVARVMYMENSNTRVVLHLTDNYSWSRTVQRNRRAMNTLVLPDDVKEDLLADIQEFLDSEEWYTLAGVPHRRGYLLHGEPGTGKSSTIHAMAGELGLEIYCISLANPGINDHSLAQLISDTPSRSILLLEDIDCAFPSREDTTDVDETEFDVDGNPTMMHTVPPKSDVTLSGLLNVLDSASSEEGRVVFATTNHIEALDPALIRPGRMDVKIQYKLATTPQIQHVFKRFYPADVYTAPEGVPAPLRSYNKSDQGLTKAETRKVVQSERRFYTTEQLDALAVRFGQSVPDMTYSVAQLQGYLLNRKWDPIGAVEGLQQWLDEQLAEKAALEEIRRKRRQEAAKRRKDFEKEKLDGFIEVNGGEAAVEEPASELEEVTPAVIDEAVEPKVNGVKEDHAISD